MSPAYLVDADRVINHFNGVGPITRRLEELRPAGLAPSIVSVAALYEGVHYARDPERSRVVLSRFLSGVTVLPIDERVCDVFGRERGKLRQPGRIVGDFDPKKVTRLCMPPSALTPPPGAPTAAWAGASAEADRARED